MTQPRTQPPPADNPGAGTRPPARAILLSMILVVAAALVTFHMTVRATPEHSLVWSDGLAYFLYARSAVVDRDLDLTDEFDVLDHRYPADSRLMEPLRKWSVRGADGRLQPPWPAGAGLVMAPFYAAGYAVEELVAARARRPPDSYGLIPQYGFAFGSLFYGLLGFWSLFMVSRAAADPGSAWLASLAATLAGPVIFYVLFNPTMAHASSFGLASVLTLVWWRAWNGGNSPGAMATLGALLGVAATVRYQNALFGLMPAALVLRDLRLRPIVPVLRDAAVGLVACGIPLAALVLGRLAVTSNGGGAVTAGHYPIDLASPYFFHVLISSRHGAFHWAPALGLGLLGLVAGLFRSDRRGWAAVLIATFALHTWLIGGLGMSSAVYADGSLQDDWLHHWDGAPSFGMRYLTECTPLLGLGLACLVQAGGRPARLLWAIALAGLALWNGLLVIAYGLNTVTRSGYLPWADMATGIARALRALLGRHG